MLFDVLKTIILFVICSITGTVIAYVAFMYFLAS